MDVSKPHWLLLAAVLLLTACGESSEPGESQSNSILLKRDDIGQSWPLTVDSVEVECVGTAVVATDVATGHRYAVNGVARSRADQLRLEQINSIWKDNPQLPGTKINIGPVLGRGLELCD